MKEKQITILIKEPGGKPKIDVLFENELEAFQEAVGGPIETVTLTEDVVMICNEEGRIRNLPYNCKVCGMKLYGSILFAGVNEDEFCSLKSDTISFLLSAIGG